MAEVYQAVVKFRRKSGITADEVENRFHFLVDDPGPDSSFTDLTTAISTFYNNVQPAGDQVGNYFSPCLDTDTDRAEVRYTPRTGPNTTNVRYIDTFTLLDPDPAGFTLPTEVAICLSWQGLLTGVPGDSPGSHPRSSRRNRIYLGPLNHTVIDQDGTTLEPKVASGPQNVFTQAAMELLTNSSLVGGQQVIWSEKLGQHFAIDTLWVDNAFDSQRRRGQRATSRTFG